MAGTIEIQALNVTRGEFTLHVDRLRIEAGEIFAILGATGSGKTVLMESIAGAFPFNSGKILLDGKNIENLPLQQRHLGILYQDYMLFPHLNVYDNIAYGLKRHRIPKMEISRRVDTMLELFSIEHIAQRYPGVISGGEAQRAALARALVLEPEILILDEPFSALDPTTKLAMYDLIRNVHEQFDCSIVFVTHDFHEAQILAHRVGIILDGQLKCVVSAESLFEQKHDPDVMRFLGRPYVLNERVASA